MSEKVIYAIDLGPDDILDAIPWEKSMSEKMRTFDTGATRSDDEGKLDFEGFLSPLVLQRYAEFLHEHRVQADGELRASDNWQRGIPLSAYMKSAWRHFHTWWKLHRRLEPAVQLPDKEQEDAICGVIFNASGYLHELLKERSYGDD